MYQLEKWLSHVKRTRAPPTLHHFMGAPTSPYLILMKFYQLLHIHFKLGSVKFQLQIINGWCASITNVEVTFNCCCRVFHDK